MNDLSQRPAAANSTTLVEQERAIQEVQAQMVIAKKFPRDIAQCASNIMQACRRPRLAENALYAYPKGNTMVTGPSIRLAETIAQCWGNFEYGVRELSQGRGVSEMEAYAWDKETNTRATKIFQVKHERHSSSGVKQLSDPRDLYELTANMGMRRVRACILGLIPQDIVEEAVEACEHTIKQGGGKSLEEQSAEMLAAFEKLSVTPAMIEARLGHNMAALQATELVTLRKVYGSIRDGMGTVEQFFPAPAQPDRANDVATALLGG